MQILEELTITFMYGDYFVRIFAGENVNVTEPYVDINRWIIVTQ